MFRLDQKYIRFEDANGYEHVVVFHPAMTHSDYGDMLEFDSTTGLANAMLSAGFVNARTLEAYGKSESMDLESEEEDSFLIKKFYDDIAEQVLGTYVAESDIPYVRSFLKDIRPIFDHKTLIDPWEKSIEDSMEILTKAHDEMVQNIIEATRVPMEFMDIVESNAPIDPYHSDDENCVRYYELKVDDKFYTFRQDVGDLYPVRITGQKFNENQYHNLNDGTIHSILPYQVVTRWGEERSKDAEIETGPIPSAKYGTLAIGAKFTCYGDEFGNYNYPKIMKCVKYNETTFREIEDGKDGCLYGIGENDVVSLTWR